MRIFPRIDKDRKDPEAGWTFIETIISIAIVLILSSVVGITAFRNFGKAKIVVAESDIDSFYQAINFYYIDCQDYPSSTDGILALWEKPSTNSEGWAGPYLTKKPGKDPWGNDYEYTVPGPNGLPFGIQSFGADNMVGGEDENKDICSWE